MRDCGDDEHNDDHGEDGEHDFDPAQRVFAGDGAGVAVDDDLIDLRAVGVAEHPHRDERVLESLLREIGIDIQIAMRLYKVYGHGERIIKIG